MNEAALQTNEFSADLYPTKEQLEAAFKVIRMARLPSIPDLVRDIRKEISQPASDLKKIAGLISQDPALPGQVL